MKIGIPSEQLAKICAIFHKHPQIKKIIVYGSRAKGNFQPGSDIDIAITGSAIDSRLLAQIDADYDALYLPWTLDVRVYDTIENQDLKDHIDRVGISLR